MSPPLYHSTIQALENFHDSIEDVWIYVCIYKVAHTYKRFYICEDYIDVCLLSSTAIKGWKSQYWFIWRVLSPSGPFQALTKLATLEHNSALFWPNKLTYLYLY